MSYEACHDYCKDIDVDGAADKLLNMILGLNEHINIAVGYLDESVGKESFDGVLFYILKTDIQRLNSVRFLAPPKLQELTFCIYCQ